MFTVSENNESLKLGHKGQGYKKKSFKASRLIFLSFPFWHFETGQDELHMYLTEEHCTPYGIGRPKAYLILSTFLKKQTNITKQNKNTRFETNNQHHKIFREIVIGSHIN